MRGVVPIPLRRSGGQVFRYGAWSSLSEANFRAYAERFDDPTVDEGVYWCGWFASRLKGYPDTENLKGFVTPQPDLQRPVIEIAEPDHPLAAEQRDGICFDRLMEIYALNGHAPGIARASA